MSKPRTVKKQKVYEFIRSRILDGTYGPGYRIVIDSIAKELQLSSIPVREAIRQLEADGLIQVIPYSGAIVQLMNDTDYQETQWVLAILDGAATALAAEEMTPQDINDLESINKAMQQAFDELDFDRFGELNKEFHETIYKNCGNAYLIDRLRLTWQRLAQIRRAAFSFVPYRAKESIKEHEELITMIRESAAPEEIEKFIRQHKLKMLGAVQHRKESK